MIAKQVTKWTNMQPVAHPKNTVSGAKRNALWLGKSGEAMSETKQPELFDPLELAKQLKMLGRFEKAERLLLSHMEKKPDDRSLQALEALAKANQYASPNAHMHSIKVRAQLMRGDQQEFTQALLQMAQDAPQPNADFFRYMIPLLQKRSSTQILQTIQVLRENDFQEDNPQLLMFELEISLRCHDLERARQCLTALESLDQPNTYQEAQMRYAEEIEYQHKRRGKPLCYNK